MDIHQSRKAEIERKQDKFTAVYNMALELIGKDHYASIEIQEKVDELKQKKELLDDEWDLHWEDMQLSMLNNF